MNIGLVAHDAKKKLMQNFCIAYRGILGKHNLYATETSGHNLPQNTGPKKKVTISKITIQAIKGSGINSSFPSSKCSV